MMFFLHNPMEHTLYYTVYFWFLTYKKVIHAPYSKIKKPRKLEAGGGGRAGITSKSTNHTIDWELNT